jgi:excisionase family DNA binding protein
MPENADHVRVDLALALVDALDDQVLDRLARRLAPLLGQLRADEDGRGRPVAYTVASLAAELGVSEKTIRGAIHRGELAATLRARRYLIDAAAVGAWTRQATHPRSGTRGSARGRSRSVRQPLRDALSALDADSRAA